MTQKPSEPSFFLCYFLLSPSRPISAGSSPPEFASPTQKASLSSCPAFPSSLVVVLRFCVRHHLAMSRAGAPSLWNLPLSRSLSSPRPLRTSPPSNHQEVSWPGGSPPSFSLSRSLSNSRDLYSIFSECKRMGLCMWSWRPDRWRV